MALERRHRRFLAAGAGGFANYEVAGFVLHMLEAELVGEIHHILPRGRFLRRSARNLGQGVKVLPDNLRIEFADDSRHAALLNVYENALSYSAEVPAVTLVCRVCTGTSFALESSRSGVRTITEGPEITSRSFASTKNGDLTS